MTVHLHKESEKIRIKRGVRQGDTISPKLLQELSYESRRMGLKMNIAKTKVVVVDNTPINVNNVPIEIVQGYVYLGQHYSLKENN